MKRAFTLIELLIVVAIIAILAAIAVPNFLEAQVRSKVARVQGELRTFATAIEAYAVDFNTPPREHTSGYYSGDAVIPPGTSTGGIMARVISTPVAYITNAWPKDPFVEQRSAIAFDEQVYSYHNQKIRANDPNWTIFGSTAAQPVTKSRHLDFYGAWRIGSIGPGRDYFNREVGARTGSRPFELSENLIYDASNGTISSGNIWRSQARADNSQPPVQAGLIGAH